MYDTRQVATDVISSAKFSANNVNMESSVRAWFTKRKFPTLFGLSLAVTILLYTYIVYDGSNSINTLRTYFSQTNYIARNESHSQSPSTTGIVKYSKQTVGAMLVETTRNGIKTEQSSSSNPATSTTAIKQVNPVVIFDRSTVTPDGVVWAKLFTGRGSVDIMVYPEHLDIWVSRALIRTGQWESMNTLAMEHLFQCDPDLGLIDIGANLGVYVLLAAKYGRFSVGVEPSLDSITRLLKSVERNTFGNSVTLVRNAVSDSYTVLQLSANPTNRGNTVIRSDKDASLHVMGQDEVKLQDRLPVGEVSTVLMDDLVPLVKFKRGILKIDIEGSEALAFKHSSQFFSMIDIKYIFMEWFWMVKDPNGAAQKIYTLLITHAYVPYANSLFKTKLNESYLIWPPNVFWMKGEECQ